MTPPILQNWNVEEGDWCGHVGCGEHRTITVCGGPANLGLFSRDSYGHDLDETRLIMGVAAAAPDMLEALEMLVADMEAEYRDRNGDMDHDGIEKAKAAITKAYRGKKP